MATDIIISLFGALVGAILSFAFTIYYSHRKFAVAPDVTGDWITEYQATDTPGNPWVHEMLHFELKMGRLIFHTYENAKNSAIEGTAELVGKDYIYGKWRERDRKASNHGTFMFHMSPSGKIIFGMWAGTSESGAKRIGGWVGARKSEELTEGKKMLSELTADFKINEISSIGKNCA